MGGVLAGDNVVWHADEIDDVKPFIRPLCHQALRTGKKLIYFRFAEHSPLVPEDVDAEVHYLDPDDGFETLLFRTHTIIAESGRGAYYVFDCLSDLVVDWCSDQMLANFFMLTCPYLYDMETVAYLCAPG
jgi:hypothetical protein